MAIVVSRLMRACSGVVWIVGAPVARWSSQARVSLPSGPRKSPTAQSPAVLLPRKRHLGVAQPATLLAPKGTILPRTILCRNLLLSRAGNRGTRCAGDPPAKGTAPGETG